MLKPSTFAEKTLLTRPFVTSMTATQNHRPAATTPHQSCSSILRALNSACRAHGALIAHGNSCLSSVHQASPQIRENRNPGSIHADLDSLIVHVPAIITIIWSKPCSSVSWNVNVLMCICLHSVFNKSARENDECLNQTSTANTFLLEILRLIKSVFLLWSEALIWPRSHPD